MDLHLGIRSDGCNYKKQEQDQDQEPAKKPISFALPSSCSPSPSFLSPSSSKLNLEQMFNKILTPSDVGKLNRLVIPKQSAERYFPSVPNKGMQLITFEDPTGNLWQFRYSYWKSSQSYVMTRGWSRFVKEKHLKAGDTVSFCRHHGRFFINWHCRPHRRPPLPLPSMVASILPMSNLRSLTSQSIGPPPNARVQVWGGGIGGTGAVVSESMPLVNRPANRKRLRLFGVNIERLEPETAKKPKGWN